MQLLTCQVVQYFFLILYTKRPLRKLVTKIFDLSVLILDVRICFSLYLSLEKVRIAVFYTRGKSVFCAVKITTLVFLVSYLHGTSKIRKKKMELLSMDHHRSP